MAASKVNGLFEVGGTLCKKLDGILNEIPARLALENFVKWALDLMGTDDPKQVILVKCNSASFDDHFLLDHLRKKLEPELFSLIRRKFFSVDIQKLLSLKGKLADNLSQCGGTEEQLLRLHDALEDCKAVASIKRTKKVDLDVICRLQR